MKNFLVTYSSEKNFFEGKKVIKAERISKAQDIFFDWLMQQTVYQHMWNLKIQIEEIDSD
jgi:hypothetical protein